MDSKIRSLIDQMTLEEKAGMCSGLDFWHFKGVDRLGIPSVMVSDGPHGLRKQDEGGDHLGINDSIKAVCFPPAALSACSYDTELMEAFGDRIGKEAQATDLAVVLGPGVNIKRSPICGRNFEYFSEDPYLAGEIASAFIKGVQKHHIGTSLKHFALNNQEYRRMTNSSEADERTMREIYLPAFEKVVKEARPYTVMCSYNQINGVFASENEWLLTKILRDEWGFDGMVISDWGAVNKRIDALKAGLEVEMPSTGGISDAQIVEAVKDGTLDEAILDRAVERILDLVFRYEDNREKFELDLEGDHEFAGKVAEESMVLLKNEGVLPLSGDEKVLFVGDFAVSPRYQGGGSSHINSWKVTGALEAAEKLGNVRYVKGFEGQSDEYDERLAAEAIAEAKDADKVVVFAGLPDSFESEGYDRKHMDMPESHNRMISEISAVNPNTIVVLHNGAPVTMPWISQVKGLLEAYLGGQASGEAVARILYGEVNPSGKLAETFPLKLADNPSYFNFGGKEKVEYREGVFVGYRYYDKKEMNVLFPFGYGQSYTAFKYSNLQLDSDKMKDGGCLEVSVDVTNTGARAGKEAVQFYVSDNTGKVQRPERELKGFAKVYLEPGETKTVSVCLDDRAFSYYSVELGDWYAFPGEYTVYAAASSRDLRLQKTVMYETDRTLPVKITMNTTVGDLLENPSTRALGQKIVRAMDAFFGAGAEDADEDTADSGAVNDDMGAAIAESQPLRGVLSFGIMTYEELTAEIERLQGLNRMDKIRTIITQDAEVDDQNSLRHFMFYANEVDLQGIVQTSSSMHYIGMPGAVKPDRKQFKEFDFIEDNGPYDQPYRWTGTDWMFRVCDDYEKDYTNLCKHADGYPSPDYIRSITKIGNIGYEGEMVAPTEGSELIRKHILDDDDRTLYLQVWGGCNTIGRALRDIQEEYKNKPGWLSMHKRLSEKIVITACGEQDDVYREYISEEWPDIMFVKTLQMESYAYPWYVMPECESKDTLRSDFMKREILKDTSALASGYCTWMDGKYYEGEQEDDQYGTNGEQAKKKMERFIGVAPCKPYDFLSEGDSPTFFMMFDWGLRTLEDFGYGGFSGRYAKVPRTNSKGQILNYWDVANDSFIDRDGNESMLGSMWQYVADIQRDFAARVAWASADRFEDGEHAPSLTIAEGTDINTRPGDTVTLHAETESPDGSEINVSFRIYKDASAVSAADTSIEADGSQAAVKVPETASPGEQIHVIVKAQANGHHRLVHYQQVILTVR